MCAFEDYTPYDSQALLNLLFTLSSLTAWALIDCDSKSFGIIRHYGHYEHFLRT